MLAGRHELIEAFKAAITAGEKIRAENPDLWLQIDVRNMGVEIRLRHRAHTYVQIVSWVELETAADPGMPLRAAVAKCREAFVQLGKLKP